MTFERILIKNEISRLRQKKVKKIEKIVIKKTAAKTKKFAVVKKREADEITKQIKRIEMKKNKQIKIEVATTRKRKRKENKMKKKLKKTNKSKKQRRDKFEFFSISIDSILQLKKIEIKNPNLFMNDYFYS